MNGRKKCCGGSGEAGKDSDCGSEEKETPNGSLAG